MSILHLRYYFAGYLVISVEGALTERFINLATREKIRMWDLRRGAGKAMMKVDIESFFDLRYLARRTGCRVHIVRKAGLPFLWGRLSRRRGLVLGFCFFITALYFFSSVILVVSIDGNEQYDDAYIRSLAAELGARPGQFKTRLDREELANGLILKEPGLAWVGIRVRGTRLIIEVAEKVKPPLEMDTPTDLVAVKDGLVSDLVIIVGEPVVKPGDTVKRGQILVRGILKPSTAPFAAPEETEALPEPVPVHARGEVWARVWYEGYGEAVLLERERVRTGRRSTVWTLRVDGQTVLRVGRSSIPFEDYELETAKQRPGERIIRFPVELITESTYEIEHHTHELTREQALDLAAERARVLAELQLPVGVKVVSVSILEVDTGPSDTAAVRYVIETVENIAVEKKSGSD